MGKCVSRQSLSATGAAHHQSVLTIALSQQDLVRAHKIWQQLTSSNEYIATTTTTSSSVPDPIEKSETFYYYNNNNNNNSSKETEALQHINSLYNGDAAAHTHTHTHLVVDTIDNPLTIYNCNSNNYTDTDNDNDYYSTCQEFLLEELVQAIKSAKVEIETETEIETEAETLPEPVATIATVSHEVIPSKGIRRQIQLNQKNNAWLASASDSEWEEGQAESKKHGGKSNRRNLNANGNTLDLADQQLQQQQQHLHTKGTAMSFGFRKKLNGTPKKFKKLLDKTIDSELITETKDDNGNAATTTITPIHFEKVGAVAAKTNPMPSATAPHGGTGVSSKRFGYRGAGVGALPRPASTGLSGPSGEESDESAANAQNNNCSSSSGATTPGGGTGSVLVSNLKRRSKSAHAGRTGSDGEPKIAQPKTLTFNLNQNTTIEYQRRQFFGEIADEELSTKRPQQRYNYNNLASMHANVIVRPTPRAPPASYAKFTLQTVSLPRPEYPVAISLTATTPTTPSSSVQSPVPAHSTGARAKETSCTSSSRQHPLTSVHAQPQGQRHLDQKSVKQLTNNSTRRGFSGSREISADSGIASMDMAMDSSSGSSSISSKRSRSRPRNLQMVMSGRHTFEVKDVDDPPSSESNSFVEPLALPKLPTDSSQTIPLPLVGLVRSNTVLSRESYERRQATTGQDQTGAASTDQQQLKSHSQAPNQGNGAGAGAAGGGSDESESIDEEKLYLDSSTSEKSAKHYSQTSSGSSWRCLAGESLAARDCSSMSITSGSTNTSSATRAPVRDNDKEEDMSLGLDDISLINTDMQFSTISSITDLAPKPSTSNSTNQAPEPLLNMHIVDNREVTVTRTSSERPRSFNNALNESKFAELALASSTCLLLDDETSPTDSLVSSTEESEEATGKLKKHRLNEELQQKDIDIDIDEISPVLELELDPGSHSPISPGTPTHASHSLSLGSDCGNLIDDEIADQPALLCNSEAQEAGNTDTPTLMETHSHTQTGSLRSLKSQSKARTALQQAIELSLRTPAAVRKAVLDRAESLDTLSPCESICSDDLMMDFDMNSSLDSIDRTVSVRSRSGSDLHRIGRGPRQGDEIDPTIQAETEAELLSELERKGSDVMKELNTLLRGRMQRSGARERISAQLPARATRLLNRSRLQDQQLQHGNDSDNSIRSTHSSGTATATATAAHKRSSANSRASTASSTSSLQRQRQRQPISGQKRREGSGAELHSSSDDLMLYDKSFRNAMIQDVLQFKKQLLRLRRILQETETLNPFENDNVQLFAACGLDSKQLNDIDLASLTSSTTEDPLQELSDLRRQGQVDDRDRTIRLQRDLIEQLEAEKRQHQQQQQQGGAGEGSNGDNVDTLSANKELKLISMATQTERTRPLAIGAEGLSRSKPEYTSYTTHFPMLHLHCNDSTVAATTIIRHHQQQHTGCHSNGNGNGNNGSSNGSNNTCPALSQTRRHTIISTTLTNYNQQLAAAATLPGTPRRASIGWDTSNSTSNSSNSSNSISTENPTIPHHPNAYKPVRITLIGDPQLPQPNGVKMRYTTNGCQSVKVKSNSNGHGPSPHYQPLYNSNKMTNPTVTIV
ncbi:pneumococcal serine-rich repeat protein isoform X2 [Drosophila willistoni]|uniref:pneumococcal serine-rich repeat protein isoform X2 n=1 Tax=Drosophila willistoni TaxID=7260 RepID=UPI001F073AB7|nr:pneumococcal serine-rich repeat protein isoform X2 [Drosophila willistoni]